MQSSPGAGGLRRAARPDAIFYTLLVAAAAILLLALGRIWWLPAHASLNLNEGWNAGHVARAFGPGLLYPAADALIANNYPPLSFGVVGLVTPLVGDAIVAGRIVSLSSQIATGVAVYVLVLRLTRDRRVASAGALLFAAFGVTLLREYLAMNDPQWLANAAMAWGLVLLMPARAGGRPSTGALIAAAALTVAGGLVKHNLVALPAAATLWLWYADRRAFRVWAGAGVMLAVAACAALWAIWGSAVFVDVLMYPRTYSLARAAAHGGPLLLAVLPGLLAARPLPRAAEQDRRQALPLLMLAVATVTALVQGSGDGVAINATFETIIALSIAAAAGCARRGRASWRWLGAAALPALAMAPIAAVADARELRGREAAVAHWRPFIARVAAAPGAVACDDQAVCYWAGRTSALDFFAIKQRVFKGDVPALGTALDRQAFTLIAMRSENRGWHENRLIPAIRRRYRPIYVEGGSELLVPR